MRKIACIALFAVAMEGVYWIAHGVVAGFGALAGVAVIVLMYLAAVLYERGQKSAEIEILPPDHLSRRR